MAVTLATPGIASAHANAEPESSPLADYARARLADLGGETGTAAQGYAQVLATAPGDLEIAERAFRQAVAAGDRALAMQVVGHVGDSERRPIDVSLFLLGEAASAENWAEAKLIVDRIEEESVFASMVPVMRAWIAYGSGQGDPIALLQTENAGQLTQSYAAEHRALLLLAMGRYDEGIAAVRAIQQVGSIRTARLRLAAASLLSANRRRDDALALLESSDRSVVAARAELERRRRIPGAVDSAAEGIAELYVRLAGDIDRSGAQPVSLMLARYATFAAPDNGAAWIVACVMLASAQRSEAALSALGHIAPNDPFYGEAEDLRVRLLVDHGDRETALAQALEHANARGATADDWARVGELQTALERHGEAADSYGRALSLAAAANAEGQAPWTSHLLYGSALVDAGRWQEARPVLERAVELGPNQPVILNYLGYALLERREELPRAEELILRASELRPDNAAITDSLGWVYYVQGDVQRAIPVLERAAQGEPAEPTINEHLGDAYWAAGRRMEARFAWQAALVSAEDSAETRIRAKIERGLTPETASP